MYFFFKPRYLLNKYKRNRERNALLNTEHNYNYLNLLNK